MRGILNQDHVYIDTCASYASTPYPELLADVKKEKRGLIGHTNAGSTGMEMTGSLGAIPKMWVNEGGVATIIPLKELEKIWRVTYDSTRDDGRFVVWTDQGNIALDNNAGGMPYIDLKKLEAKAALSLVQTVRGNKEGYTKREFEEARRAREAQAMVGHPTDRDFLGMVRANMILNCPISDKAVDNANRIFGPELAGVRGQTVRKTPVPVTTDYIQIPRGILERHRLVVVGPLSEHTAKRMKSQTNLIV